ncbi:hypothetical protein K470DRAFT_296203 [Piedraia hortae CBS 480.64]|uniref:Uncharacterized protein n=1 Tax=Piedraia hortae CBS 480.64 TaxID=1314780 RepID=A0A6A7BUS8_9PEZI|nr:hypothetical protein K470DRAFT_296203 [Piedraia hortae CBS 480.64]
MSTLQGAIPRPKATAGQIFSGLFRVNSTRLEQNSRSRSRMSGSIDLHANDLAHMSNSRRGFDWSDFSPPGAICGQIEKVLSQDPILLDEVSARLEGYAIGWKNFLTFKFRGAAGQSYDHEENVRRGELCGLSSDADMGLLYNQLGLSGLILAIACSNQQTARFKLRRDLILAAEGSHDMSRRQSEASCQLNLKAIWSVPNEGCLAEREWLRSRLLSFWYNARIKYLQEIIAAADAVQ